MYHFKAEIIYNPLSQEDEEAKLKAAFFRKYLHLVLSPFRLEIKQHESYYHPDDEAEYHNRDYVMYHLTIDLMTENIAFLLDLKEALSHIVSLLNVPYRNVLTISFLS